MSKDIVSRLLAAGLKQTKGIDWPEVHFDGGGASSSGEGGNGSSATGDSGDGGTGAASSATGGEGGATGNGSGATGEGSGGSGVSGSTSSTGGDGGDGGDGADGADGVDGDGAATGAGSNTANTATDSGIGSAGNDGYGGDQPRRPRPANAVKIAIPAPKEPRYTGNNLIEQVQNANPGLKPAEANAVAAKLYYSGVTDLNTTQAYGYADAKILDKPAEINPITGEVIKEAIYRAPTAADIDPEYDIDMTTAKGDPLPRSFDLGNRFTADLSFRPDGMIASSVSYHEPDRGFFGNLLSNPVFGLAVAVFAPELLPSLGAFAAPAVMAATGLAAGEDLEKVLTKAGLAYAGASVAGNVASGLSSTVGSTAAKVIGNVAGQEVASGGKLDPVQALISGGLSAGTGAVLGEIPGFGDLSKSAQAAVTSAVSRTLQSGEVDPASAVRAAIAAGISTAQNTGPKSSDMITDYFAPGGEGYVDTSGDIGTNFANDFAADTRGDWNEVTGRFVPDPNGGTTFGQINPETSGNVGNMNDWAFDPATSKWAWTDPATGTTTNYDYATPIKGGPLQTGKDIEVKAGASTGTSTTPGVNTTPAITPAPVTKTPAAPAGASPSTSDALTALLAGLSANKAAAGYMPSVGDVAHIKSNESLYGALPWDDTPATSAKDEQPTDAVDALEQSQYATGGHVDDFDVDTLLNILRS